MNWPLGPGAVVADRYRLDHVLGQGGFGQVWAATHVITFGRAALKFLKCPPHLLGQLRERFLREARATAAINHPNVVLIHDFFQLDDGTPVIVMDLLEGETLGAHLQREGARPLREVANLLLPVVSAVGAAHALGIVHRDVKPDNVFLVGASAGTPQVRVLDFGIVKLMDDGSTDSQSALRTDTGTMLGTPSFMSPEQSFGEKQIDHRTDIWAIGAILYQALSGVLPVRGDNLRQVLKHLLSDDIAPLASLMPELPTDMTELVDRMLAPERDARPRDLNEVYDVLARYAVVKAPRFGRPGQHVSSSSRPRSNAQAILAPVSDVVPVANLDRKGIRDSHRLVVRPISVSTADPTFWRGLGGGLGVFHEGRARAGTTHIPRLVAIFVSASDSDADGDWAAVPQRFFQNQGLDTDALSFDFVIGPTWRDDIDAAVRCVTEAVNDTCATALSLVFVATDEALPIVQDVVRSGRLITRTMGKNERKSPTYRDSIALRTREIVELGVARPQRAHGPHTTAASGQGSLAATLLVPDIDRQRDEEYLAWARELGQLGLPQPILKRTSQPSRSLASSQEVAERLAEVLDFRAYLATSDLVVATESVARATDLDRTAQIQALIVGSTLEAGDDSAGPTLDYGTAGAQREIHDELLAALAMPALRPQRLIVTGEAGVGKSTVLRTLARTLAVGFLATGQSALLPIFLPLQQEVLSAEDAAALASAAASQRGRVLFDALARRWCEWASNLVMDRSVTTTPEWLAGRLSTLPTVLIFDGIDEFLINNRGVGLSDIRELLIYGATGLGARKNHVIAGVRSSVAGIRALGASSKSSFEVLPLEFRQAKQLFPAVGSLLDSVADPALRKLILTPLILARLGSGASPRRRRSLTSAADIIESALFAVIEESNLTDISEAEAEPTDSEQWLNALTLLGWIFYQKLVGSMLLDELEAEARRIQSRWQQFAAHHAQAAHIFVLLHGFQLIQGKTLELLLQRTIFFPTGPERVRFSHREWLEFLAARYLALCIQHRNIDELQYIGIAPRIHKTAGELLCRAGVRVDDQLVRNILARAAETRQALIAANFSALMTSSGVQMDGAAIDLLLSSLSQIQPVGRCIALNGLGYRALRDDDATGLELRLRLVPIFEACLAHTSALGFVADRVICSIAWCYLKAFSLRFGVRGPKDPWPELGEDEQSQAAALAVMCLQSDAGPRLLPEHRSVQAAFLQAQYLTLEDPFRPISVVHYLYYLVVARRHRAHIPELARELPATLNATGGIAKVINGYTAVPELAQIFAACNRIHDAAD